MFAAQDSTRGQQLKVEAAMFSSRMLVKFGRYYRKGWEYQRQLYTRDAITSECFILPLHVFADILQCSSAGKWV